MWNSEAPLKLLMSMPSYLTLENLKNIQQIIDDDKFINSQDYQHDLCGEYAPFCENCDKSVKYPCAVAYIKMKQEEGLKVDMEIAAVDAEEPQTEEEIKTEEEPNVEPEPEPVKEENDKHYIRIAIAKRKH